MLKEISLKPDLYKDYETVGKANLLSGLNRVNIFIGPNNAGKSRFMRMLFTDEESGISFTDRNYAAVVEEIDKAIKDLREQFDRISMADVNDISAAFAKLSDKKHLPVGDIRSTITKIRELATTLSMTNHISGYSPKPNLISNGNPSDLIPYIKSHGKAILEKLNENFPPDFDYKFFKMYIPILRGLRPIQMSAQQDFTAMYNDNYYHRTVSDYFGNKKKDWEGRIFTGLNLYEDLKKLLLGKKEGRDRVRHFEDFLSKTFFHKQNVSLVPDINKDVLLIMIGDEEKHIYDHGDGIQNLITLLYPLFLHSDRNLMVFIEEPEISLHPGFQRLFLETILRPEFAHVQFFMTTHSNHFLDLSLDLDKISIYTFHKTQKNGVSITSIENTSNPTTNILDLIGARNSSVLLSNCSVWVEGITDRLYLKKTLMLYQEHLLAAGEIVTPFREDIHFSFVEYGGSNITHWSFEDDTLWEQIKSSALNNRIYIVADQDNTIEFPDSGKAGRHQRLREQLGDRFQVIDGKEIENILSEQVLIRTLEDMQKPGRILTYDKEVLSPPYGNQGMGAFIEDNFKGLSRKYKAESGTISCKLEFCKTAIRQMKSYNDLSKQQQEITTDIFNFIKTANT